MKRILAGTVLAALLLAGATARSQLFDNLQALSGVSYRVGDPVLSLTNHAGDPVEGPKDIAVADLDGDGVPDFIVSNKDGSVTLRYGTGDGKFSAAAHLHTWIGQPADAHRYWFTNHYTNVYCNWQPTNFTLSCHTNVNGAAPPVTNVFCITNYHYGCLGQISNVFTNVFYLDGPFGLRGLAVADFSGDGRLDIAVASPGEETIYLFFNEGARQFSVPTNLPGWFGVRDLAAGDFDGDGRIDLAAAGTTNGVAQYRSLGGGAFEAVTAVTNLASNATSDGEDFDFPQPAYYLKALRQPGDTQDELIVSHAQRGKIFVLRAGLDGRLAVSGDIDGVALTSLDAAPVLHRATNGAPPDLITSYSRGGCLDVFPATNATQRFSGKAVQRLYVPGAPRNIRIADLDGDGWNDVVVVAQLTSQVLIYKNTTGTLALATATVAGNFPREMDLGDFNADGRPDLAVLNRYSFDVSVFITATNLDTPVGFVGLDSLYPVDGGVNGLEVRDYNADGLGDVVQLHLNTAEISVRLAKTNGMLNEPQFYPFGGRPSAQSVVDVNNDHIPDMVAVDLNGSITVRLGLGNGSFGPERTFFLPSHLNGQLYAMVAADFDNDGYVDIAAGYWDCRLVFFKGSGDGTFAVVGDYDHPLTFTYEARSMAAADFDGDGDLDLAGAGLDGSLVILENKGNLLTTNRLTLSHYPSPGLFDIRSIQVLDANNDGDWDLFLAGTGGSALYLGGPGLSFTLDETSIPPRVNGASTAQADFDGDGLIDLAVADAYNKTVTILVRTDANHPYYPAITVKVPSATYLAAGDIDGDGKADLVGTGEVLWVALSSRHTAAAPPPAPLASRGNRGVVINEVLSQNTSLPLAEDGNRRSDWVELYSGATTNTSLANWQLQLIRTNLLTLTATNVVGGSNQLVVSNMLVVLTHVYVFPPDASLAPGGYRILICSDRIRTPYHTGFNLPAEGAWLVLRNAQGAEVNQVSYPALGADLAYSRYSDGTRSFVVNNIPSPSAANVDNGAVDPVLTFNGVDLETLRNPGGPLRFRATARDDVGVVSVGVLWRRLDVPDPVTKRVILYDDGMSNDDGLADGVFAGRLTDDLPPGAEIQFYIECTDFTDQVVTTPGNPRFVSPGQRAQMHALAIGVPRLPLEISEIVANNVSGLADEKGDRPDWVEIRNCSSNTVALAAVSLGPKLFGDSERMSFTNQPTLGPGEHIVIYADSKPTQGQLHAPFKLDRLGEQLILAGSTASGARYLIDTLTYGPQAPDSALGRLGCGGPWVQSPPTPRAGNLTTSWRTYVDGNQFLLAYPTRAGKTYTVEYRDALGTGSWIPGSIQRSVGLEQFLQQPMAPTRFYRVREE